MKIYCFSDSNANEEFNRLKQKKWLWQFLASGEGSESPMNQWNITFYLGNTKDNRFWALKHKEWHGRIVVVAELEIDAELDVPNIAKQMLNTYKDWYGFYIGIYHEKGKIPLPEKPCNIYLERERPKIDPEIYKKPEKHILKPGEIIFPKEKKHRHLEEYKKDVHSFFSELRQTKSALESKYNVGFINKDAEKDENEFCYDRDYQHPDMTRYDVMKSRNLTINYKEASQLGVGGNTRMRRPWDGKFSLPLEEVFEIIDERTLCRDDPQMFTKILSELEKFLGNGECKL